MHKLFGKNRHKYFNMHNKSTLTYFKTSLAAFGFLVSQFNWPCYGYVFLT